jgi:hypothetical protein
MPTADRVRATATLREMRNRLLVAVALVAIGSAVVALPDSGRRLVSLSKEHGPSALDAVGVVILLLGWVLAAKELWARRRMVLRRAGHRRTVVASFATGLGSGLLVASVFGDFVWWWAIGAAVVAAVQVAAFMALRSDATLARRRGARAVERGGLENR